MAEPHPTPASDLVTLVRNAEAILLDYNGTLSDDEALLAELIGVVSARELGVPVSTERYYAEFAGFTEEHMFKSLAMEAGMDAPPSPSKLLRIFNRLYLDRTREHSTINEHSRAFVRVARAYGKRVSVVTAASRDVVVPALEQAGLIDAFDDVVTLEDAARPKPDPDAYLLALDLLGIDASHAIAFEDSRAGILAATRADLTTIAVRGSLSNQALAELTAHAVDALHPSLIGAAPPSCCPPSGETADRESHK